MHFMPRQCLGPNSMDEIILQCSSEMSDQRTCKTHAPFLRIRIGYARMRHSWVFSFIIHSRWIFFVCCCLAKQTTMNNYSFLTEMNICFPARMYTCLEFQTDQWNSQRMKFTAVSTRFLNLGWELPINAVLEVTYLWNKSQQFFTISFR